MTTQRDRIIAKLKQDGEITNVWATQHHIFRLSERMRELQELGWQFDADFVRENGKKTGTYRYVLKGQPQPKPRVVYELVERNGERVRVAREV